MALPLVLGLDASTQSLSAVVVDRRDASIVRSQAVTYATDPRLTGFGLDPDLVLLPPRREGEADQPPLLFAAALDALLRDLTASGLDLGLVGLINVAAQQHGHVYLGAGFAGALGQLRAGTHPDQSLDQVLAGSLSHPRAPIWKTSDTGTEAQALREAAGGAQAMIRLTGSDSPLRFTGAVARRTFGREPGVWDGTWRLMLLSTWLPAVLTANPDVAADWGNASGTSLMDYGAKAWSPKLLEAAAAGQAGRGAALADKLTPLASPLSLAGRVSPWFCRRFGFSSEAGVMIGTGDNPATKSLVSGDLLSLGTSFVMMVESEAALEDGRGWGNAMYDGLGRPFLFGCRTNGALVWDRLRSRFGLAPRDYRRGEDALAAAPLGAVLALWQPDAESFPPSPVVPLTVRGAPDTYEAVYPGCVDSALGLLYNGARPWLEGRSDPLVVTGGPAASPGIVARIAALWNRPVVTIGTTGAALGAAAAALAFDGVRLPLLPASAPVLPDPEAVRRAHGPGGYLERLAAFAQETLSLQGDNA